MRRVVFRFETHQADVERRVIDLQEGRDIEADARAAISALAWVDSDEGRASLAEALEASRKASEEMRKARRVDWRTMHVPCDASRRLREGAEG